MNIKKVIAWEGLIFMGVILLGCLIGFVTSIYPPYDRPLKKYPANIQAKLDNGKPLTDEDVAKMDVIDGDAKSDWVTVGSNPAKGKFDITTARPVKDDYAEEIKGKRTITTEELFRDTSVNSDYEVIGSNPAKGKFDITTARPVSEMTIEELESELRELKRQEALRRIKQAQAELNRRTEEKRDRIRGQGLSILLLAYALYLIPIKFAIWAIRTLKAK